MTIKIIQKIVVGGVVFKGDSILILKRNSNEDVYPNIWELPSGKKEPLELSEQALLREIKEETDLDVDIIAPICVFDYTIKRPDETRDTTQINFLVKPRNLEVRLSEEHQNYTWIREKDIDNFDVTEATKKVIRQAFDFMSKSN